MPVDKYDFNEADSDEPFAGIFGTGKTGIAGIGLDGYWLYRERKNLDGTRYTLNHPFFNLGFVRKPSNSFTQFGNY